MKIENEQKVEQFKDEIKNFTAEDCMIRYRSIESKRKEIVEQKEFADALLDALEERLNNFLLETNQSGTITTCGNVKRVVKETYYVEDKPLFREWAVNNGKEELMAISVTQKAIKQFVDDQYQDYLKQQAEAEKTGVVLPPFTVTLPKGLNIKQEFKLSITKK